MYTYSDLQTAGLILACKHLTCRITGKPLYDADFVQWAKEVLSYFARSAWDFARKLKKALKEAWKYILDNAKELDRINGARRKAKAMDKAKAMQQTRQSVSFRSVPPIVAQYGQTGKQLQKGKEARENYQDLSTIKPRKSRHYVK